MHKPMCSKSFRYTYLLIYFLLSYYCFMCMGALLACMSAHVFKAQQRQGEGSRFPRLEMQL